MVACAITLYGEDIAPRLLRAANGEIDIEALRADLGFNFIPHLLDGPVDLNLEGRIGFSSRFLQLLQLPSLGIQKKSLQSPDPKGTAGLRTQLVRRKIGKNIHGESGTGDQYIKATLPALGI